MSEPTQGASPMNELCRHLPGLTQAIKDLQEGYTQLEGRVQALSSSASTSSGASTTPSVIMLPPEPKVPTPERFSGKQSKFRTMDFLS